MELQGKKILIVDDEKDIRIILSDLFKEVGLEVEEACDGKEALVKINEKNYDFIITDILMPNMNGFDLLTQVSCYSSTKPKFIIATGCIRMDFSNEQQNLIEILADGYICKPFGCNEILNMIKNPNLDQFNTAA